MKRARDLKGMSILTLQEGEDLGRVREIIVEPDAAHVVALLLDERTPGGEPQVVATANIRNIGPSVITVEDRSSRVPISRIPRFQQLAQAKETSVFGKRVITESGSHLGRVGELLVDPKDFQIAALELKKLFGRGQRIPAEQIRTIGPDAIVIEEQAPIPVPARPRQPAPTPSPAEAQEPQEEEPQDATVLDSDTLVELSEPSPPEPLPETEDRPLGEETEPAVPPISTVDEMPPPPAEIEEALPEEEIFEEEPPAEEEPAPEEEPETAEMAEEEPAPEEEPDAAETPEAEPEGEAQAEEDGNAWQRWVRRLRRQEEEGQEA